MPSLWTSFRESVIRPRNFFANLEPKGPLGPALAFVLFFSFIGTLGFAINDLYFPNEGEFWTSPWAWYWNFIQWPIYLVLEYLGLLWFHYVLRWRGGAAFPFRATFRAYSFSAVPNLFCLIPLFGPWIAIVWGLYLSFLAVKTVQRTSWTRVLTSFFIANAVLALLAMALIFTAGFFWHYFE